MSKRRPGSKHFQALDKRRWARTRRAVFERDQFRCRNCGKAGRLEAHHEPPLSEGGDPYNPDGVLTLCRSCHIEHHRPAIDPAVLAWREFVRSLTY